MKPFTRLDLSQNGYHDAFVGMGFGAIPGHARVVVLGNHPDLDVAALPEEIWPVPGAYPFQASAVALFSFCPLAFCCWGGNMKA